jgi:hypothetical protein
VEARAAGLFNGDLERGAEGCALIVPSMRLHNAAANRQTQTSAAAAAAVACEPSRGRTVEQALQVNAGHARRGVEIHRDAAMLRTCASCTAATFAV